MTINIATHVRIFDPDPQDDLVVKRTAAIDALGGRFNKKSTVPAILQWANDLAIAVESKGSHLSDLLSKEIEAAIRKPSDAFVAEGQGLQMTVCGLLGALQSLDGAQPSSGTLTVADVLAVGLWSALSFQTPRTEPKIEALRSELLGKAQELVLASATSSRKRQRIPEPEIAEPKEFNAAGVGQSVKSAFKATIDALASNAAIDREEIDLLWWVLGDRSELLARRLSSGQGPAALAVAAGLEAGRMLRRMPGEAHRHLVLRNLAGQGSSSLAELLKAVGDDRAALSTKYADDPTIVACPAIFPLITMLRTGSASHARSKSKHSLADWATRALLESAAHHVTSHVPSVAV